MRQRYGPDLPKTEEDRQRAQAVLDLAQVKARERQVENWGALAEFGLDRSLEAIDDKTRTNFTPYGLSGVMLGAALVFFAFIAMANYGFNKLGQAIGINGWRKTLSCNKCGR